MGVVVLMGKATTPTKMTDTTDKLLPDSLVSALQTLVSVATISLITFGDRTLNAALAALATVLFSLSMERIQKYKSWSHLCESLELANFNMLFKWVGSKGFKEQSKGPGPTDFDPQLVPAVPVNTLFKYSIDLRGSDRIFNAWAFDTFGSQVIFEMPESQLAMFSSIKNEYIIGEVEVPSYSLGINKFVPIWRSNGIYVYKTFMEIKEANCRKDSELIVSNSKEALYEVVRAINEHAVKKKAQHNSVTIPHQLTIYSVETATNLWKRNGQLSKTRTFDHLFFEQKNELLEILTRFKNGTMYAEHLGEDNKLGILLYGPPGTGKTFCMGAIANFLQRHAVTVSGPQLLKRRVMDLIFSNSDDLIIMDEFDCLMDVIKKRSGIMGSVASAATGDMEPNSFSGPSKGTNNMKYLEASNYFKLASEEKDPAIKKELMTKYEDVMNSEEDVVDMAYILSKFQGIQSGDGRCIVACTNDPSRIDDALKRKGRFDIIIHLDYASPSIIFDMVAHYFLLTPGEKMALSEEFLGSLPMKVIAPATVQDINASSRSAREALNRMAAMRSLPCLMAPNSPRQSVSSSGSTGEPA